MYMWQSHKENPSQKVTFLNGYNKILETINLKRVICYHELFNEMTGAIVYINYEQSSWRYLNN